MTPYTDDAFAAWNWGLKKETPSKHAQEHSTVNVVSLLWNVH